jgi:Ca2+-binding EF-hand superfamily protein
MRRHTILCASLAGLLALTGARLAQADHHQEHDSEKQKQQQSGQSQSNEELQAKQFVGDFDDDGNGKLSKQELPPRMRSTFDRLDRDSDGQLTADELRQHGRQAGARRAVPLEIVYIWVNDADRGRLSVNELQRAYDTLQKIDQDGNGQLARSELRARQKHFAKKWARTVSDRLDENDNGKISQQEAQGTFLSQRFDRIDKDGDGTVTRQELQQCMTDLHAGPDQTQEMRTGSQDREDETRQSRNRQDENRQFEEFDDSRSDDRD